MDEEQVENPLTAAFWINLVLVIIGIIVVCRLTVLAQKEEPELFDPYTTLGIPIGASDKMIKSAYRKMAKMHGLYVYSSYVAITPISPRVAWRSSATLRRPIAF